MSDNISRFHAAFADLNRQRKSEVRPIAVLREELSNAITEAASVLDASKPAERRCLIEGVCEATVWGDSLVAVQAIGTIADPEIRRNVAYMACACAVGLVEHAPDAVGNILKADFLRSPEIGKILTYAEKIRDKKIEEQGDTTLIEGVITRITPILADHQRREAEQAKNAVSPTAALRYVAPHAPAKPASPRGLHG